MQTNRNGVAIAIFSHWNSREIGFITFLAVGKKLGGVF